MIVVKVVADREEKRVALNENFIVSITDRKDKKDDWNSSIEMSNGAVYYCAECLNDLLSKIHGRIPV